MKHNVDKILLFTLAACPTGRSMSQVLGELHERYPELATQIYYTEVHIAETNHYRIKQNPTLLFLSKEGKELSRLEGFHETEAVETHLHQLEEGTVGQEVPPGENVATLEKYSLHLYKEAQLQALEVEYLNPTGVKAPRITAIQLQLTTQKPGLINPFPEGTKLELVQFDGAKGCIYLQMDQPVTDQQLERMKRALQATLKPFGIEEIEVQVNQNA